MGQLLRLRKDQAGKAAVPNPEKNRQQDGRSKSGRTRREDSRLESGRRAGAGRFCL